MKKNIFYLTGFMGSGKSTIGPILANTLGWQFYDLDKVIEAAEKKKVKEIFKEKGEDYFRKIETDTLKELSEGDKIIISLGGGTIIFKTNYELMRSSGTIIYLHASMESIYFRLRYKTDRPVINPDGLESLSKDEMLQRITKLFNEREKFYKQADLIIDTDKMPIGKAVDHLAHYIEKNIAK
jgi:shikimate kinase